MILKLWCEVVTPHEGVLKGTSVGGAGIRRGGEGGSRLNLLRWAEEARAYNELVAAWSGIEQASVEVGIVGSQEQLDI